MIKILFLLLALTKYRNKLLMSIDSNNESPNNRWVSVSKINTNYTTVRNKTSGCDERYSINDNYDELYKINKHFNNYNLLKTLEDETISTNHKLKLIDNYNKDNYNSTYILNITQGGLYKDWNFII